MTLQAMKIKRLEKQVKKLEAQQTAYRWFREWSSDINSDMTPDELVEKHGFEFELKEVETDYREVIKRGR